MPRRAGDGRAVAGVGVGVGGDLPDAPVPAGGEDDRLGVEDVQLAGGQVQRHHARRAPVLDHQQIDHLELVEEGDVVLQALLVQRLQDHVPGAVGGMAARRTGLPVSLLVCPPKGRWAILPIGRAVEGQAHVLQLVDGVDGLVAHELDGILVAQVVGAFDGVVGMPFGVVFLLVAERRADAALGGAGMRAGGVEFADDGGLGGPGGVQAAISPAPPAPTTITSN